MYHGNRSITFKTSYHLTEALGMFLLSFGNIICTSFSILCRIQIVFLSLFPRSNNVEDPTWSCLLKDLQETHGDLHWDIFTVYKDLFTLSKSESWRNLFRFMFSTRGIRPNGVFPKWSRTFTEFNESSAPLRKNSIGSNASCGKHETE